MDNSTGAHALQADEFRSGYEHERRQRTIADQKLDVCEAEKERWRKARLAVDAEVVQLRHSLTEQILEREQADTQLAAARGQLEQARELQFELDRAQLATQSVEFRLSNELKQMKSIVDKLTKEVELHRALGARHKLDRAVDAPPSTAHRYQTPVLVRSNTTGGA